VQSEILERQRQECESWKSTQFVWAAEPIIG